MSWDPITRIVGNLGIYTKIDFDNREVVVVQEHVVAVPRLQRVHEGQGPARRALHHEPHLRHLRRQPRRLLAATRRTWPTASRRRRWASGSSTSARRPSTSSTTSSSRTTWCSWTSASRWSRRRTRACWTKAEKTEAPRADVHGYRTIADIMRSYNPFTGETYREALHMSRIGREMICLMEGRHVHPSTIYPGGVGTVADADAVHRLPQPAAALPRLHQEGRRDERRRLRLLLRGAARLRGGRAAADPARLLGRVQQPRPRRLRLPEHGRLGQRDVRHPGRRRRRRAGHHRTSSTSTSASGSCSGSSYYEDWANEETFVAQATRSATRSTSATRGTRRRSRSRRSATSRAATTAG